jgi:hypothetical protein
MSKSIGFLLTEEDKRVKPKGLASGGNMIRILTEEDHLNIETAPDIIGDNDGQNYLSHKRLTTVDLSHNPSLKIQFKYTGSKNSRMRGRISSLQDLSKYRGLKHKSSSVVNIELINSEITDTVYMQHMRKKSECAFSKQVHGSNVQQFIKRNKITYSRN